MLTCFQIISKLRENWVVKIVLRIKKINRIKGITNAGKL